MAFCSLWFLMMADNVCVSTECCLQYVTLTDGCQKAGWSDAGLQSRWLECNWSPLEDDRDISHCPTGVVQCCCDPGGILGGRVGPKWPIWLLYQIQKISFSFLRFRKYRARFKVYCPLGVGCVMAGRYLQIGLQSYQSFTKVTGIFSNFGN
jgi:hypothetical protein